MSEITEKLDIRWLLFFLLLAIVGGLIFSTYTLKDFSLSQLQFFGQGSVCGNGLCENGESWENCPTDCAEPSGSFTSPIETGGLPPVEIVGTSLAQCPAGYPLYCANINLCFPSGYDCSTVGSCAGSYYVCKTGQQLICFENTPYCFDECIDPNQIDKCNGNIYGCWKVGCDNHKGSVINCVDGTVKCCPLDKPTYCPKWGSCEPGLVCPECKVNDNCAFDEICLNNVCTKLDCNDNDLCTKDYPVNHQCVYESIQGCCIADFQCKDNQECLGNVCKDLICPEERCSARRHSFFEATEHQCKFTVEQVGCCSDDECDIPELPHGETSVKCVNYTCEITQKCFEPYELKEGKCELKAWVVWTIIGVVLSVIIASVFIVFRRRIFGGRF